MVWLNYWTIYRLPIFCVDSLNITLPLGKIQKSKCRKTERNLSKPLDADSPIYDSVLPPFPQNKCSFNNPWNLGARKTLKPLSSAFGETDWNAEIFKYNDYKKRDYNYANFNSNSKIKMDIAVSLLFFFFLHLYIFLGLAQWRNNNFGVSGK